MTDLELRCAAREFRIAPHNKVIIEWRIVQPGAPWCFFMVTDSPNEAKRILWVRQGSENEQSDDDSGAREDHPG